jgi:type I restriction enzyme S subunit
MSNVPKLRFKEFSGEWEEKKFGSYGKLINGLTYSPSDTDESGLLVLRSSNIQNNQVSFEDNVYVNFEVQDDSLTKANDILICVRNGSKRLIGKSVLIPENMPKATHGAFMTVFRGEANQFIIHWMQTPMYYKQVHQNLGATINSINGSDLKKFKTVFPSKIEQQKIASFLSAVDTKIDQLTRKKELIEQYKKGVMQKIFSQELRFKDEDGSEFPEWEEKKLGDIFKKITNTIQIQDDEIYKQITITNNGIVKHRDEKQGLKIGRKRQFLISFKEGQYILTFIRQGIFNGGIGFIDKVFNGYIVTENMPLLNVITNKILPEYFTQYLKSESYAFNILFPIKPTGSAQSAIHEKEWLQQTDVFPSLPEQTKIANFLSAIDTEITLRQAQGERLKQFKKGLLQQMFV